MYAIDVDPYFIFFGSDLTCRSTGPNGGFDEMVDGGWIARVLLRCDERSGGDCGDLE